MVVKIVPQAVPGPRGPHADGKGTLTLVRAIWETYVKYLRNVFC